MAETMCNYLLLLVIVPLAFAASDISHQNVKCEMACDVNYSHSAAESGYCQRGCRLMRLTDFASYSQAATHNVLQLLQTCSDACGRAYSGQAVVTASRACQTGCKLELPAVENRFRQLQMFYYEQVRYLQMFDMINRLMTCYMQSHVSGPSQLDRTGDRYFRASVVYVSSSDGSVSRISMSRGVDAGVKAERHDSESKLTEHLLGGGKSSRLYMHVARVDPAVVIIFVFGIVLLIGLSLSLCWPVKHSTPLPAKPQKLSIYGDGDFLSTLDDDDALIDIKPRAQLFVAAPLPSKCAP